MILRLITVYIVWAVIVVALLFTIYYYYSVPREVTSAPLKENAYGLYVRIDNSRDIMLRTSKINAKHVVEVYFNIDGITAEMTFEEFKKMLAEYRNTVQDSRIDTPFIPQDSPAYPKTKDYDGGLVFFHSQEPDKEFKEIFRIDNNTALELALRGNFEAQWQLYQLIIKSRQETCEAKILKP